MERVIEAVIVTPPSTEVSRQEKDQIVEGDHGRAATVEAPGIAKEISQRQLIDKLNSLNFQDRTLNVVFRHKQYPRDITLRAQPLPCHNARLTCRWVDPFDFNALIDTFAFHRLYVPKGQQYVEVIPEVRSISEEQIVFSLPERCTVTGILERQRHECAGVSAYIFQNGATYYGRLIDYGALQFRVSVATLPPQSFRWIDEGAGVTIVFARETNTLYSGECRIVAHDGGLKEREFTLEPNQNHYRRFPPREFRNTRHQLSPPPDVRFEHPLSGKPVNLKIHDLSGSGFSVEEDESSAMLLPGLILPKVELTFSDGSSLSCMAQVVYCKSCHDRKMPYVRCGLVILDISVEDHIRLLGVMHQATDVHSYLSSKVDMTELWDFFFETGFIYPQKYEFIQSNKEHIKATYEKLYNNSPTIASHFIYKQNGRIMAHGAIMRCYEASWMLHHHAAIRSVQNRGGLFVLNQGGRFINESHRLYAMKMDYVICYFRPENKFPSHIFGGSARNINNPRICSVDLFAYLHHRFAPEESRKNLPGYWQLDEVRAEDLDNLQTVYENLSGGLMLQGLHLTPERLDCSGLIEAYHKIGLKRERHVLALRYRDKLCAVIMANVADLGLNMSDLTNAVTFIEVDPQPLTGDIFRTVIDNLSHVYGAQDIPVMVYPQAAAARMDIETEKNYCLWVYDTQQNLDYYFRYLKRLWKFIQH
jgi:hypothetical protein